MGRTRTALYAAAVFLALSLVLGLAWWRWFRDQPLSAAAEPAPVAAAAPDPAGNPGAGDPGIPAGAAPPAGAAAAPTPPPASPGPAALPGEPGVPAAFRPGRYRVTVKILNKLRAGQSQGPFVDEQCLSAEEPAPRGHVPPGCRAFDLRHEGDTYRWRIRCLGPRMGDGIGSARLAPDGTSLEGTLRLWLPNPITTAPQRNDQTFTGQRVGDC